MADEPNVEINVTPSASEPELENREIENTLATLLERQAATLEGIDQCRNQVQNLSERETMESPQLSAVMERMGNLTQEFSDLRAEIGRVMELWRSPRESAPSTPEEPPLEAPVEAPAPEPEKSTAEPKPGEPSGGEAPKRRRNLL